MALSFWGELGPLPRFSAARQKRQKLQARKEDENWDLGDPLADPEWEARLRAAVLFSGWDGDPR
jgi:hypothetical protein